MEVFLLVIYITDMVRIYSTILQKTINSITDLKLHTLPEISSSTLPLFDFDLGSINITQLENIKIKLLSQQGTTVDTSSLAVTFTQEFNISSLFGPVGVGASLNSQHLWYNELEDNTVGGIVLQYSIVEGLKFPLNYRTVFKVLIVEYEKRIDEINNQLTDELHAIFLEAQDVLNALIVLQGGGSYTVTATQMRSFENNPFLKQLITAIFNSVIVYIALVPGCNSIVYHTESDSENGGVISYSDVVKLIKHADHTVGADMLVTFSGLKIDNLDASYTLLQDIPIRIGIDY